MRILPIANYQAQNQSNNSKKQCTNFGMITAPASTIGMLHNKKLFFRLSQELKDVLDVIMEVRKLDCKSYSDLDVKTLNELIYEAEEKNIGISETEKESLVLALVKDNPKVSELLTTIKERMAHPTEIKGEHSIDFPKWISLNQELDTAQRNVANFKADLYKKFNSEKF